MAINVHVNMLNGWSFMSNGSHPKEPLINKGRRKANAMTLVSRWWVTKFLFGKLCFYRWIGTCLVWKRRYGVRGWRFWCLWKFWW